MVETETETERDREREETTDERAMVSNTAVQNSQSNSTKQITSNFLGGSSTHAVPSACIPRNLDQRGRRISSNPRPFSPPFRLPPRVPPLPLIAHAAPLLFPRPLCFGISPPPPLPSALPFISAFHTSGLSVAPDTARISNSGCLTSVSTVLRNYRRSARNRSSERLGSQRQPVE